VTVRLQGLPTRPESRKTSYLAKTC
jgi:hypothetical protein